MMLLTIDGKQVPTNPSSLRMRSMYDTTMALFIMEHLKPESVIGWINLESDEGPTYEGLMMYAQCALPFYRPKPMPIRYRYNRNPMFRMAIMAMCGYRENAKAEYITYDLLQSMNAAVMSKREASRKAWRESFGSIPLFEIDSIPQPMPTMKYSSGSFADALRRLER